MDSLKIYERLKQAKFDEAKAKELANIFSLFAESSPASKQDLHETELRTVREMKEIDAKLSKEIEGIRSSTIRWVAGLILANTGLMVSMLKFL